MVNKNNINYDVYNALNLMHEDLGDSYLKQAFNPMEEGFVLTEEFVIDRFLNSKNQQEIMAPQFVNGGEKTFKQALEFNQKNCEESLNQINNLLNSSRLSKAQKEELKKLKLYLICRMELARKYLKTLKKQKNKFKLYLNINSLNWKYSEIFEEAYEQLFDAQIAIKNFLYYVKQNAKDVKQQLKDENLKQQAKQIVNENILIKNQEAKEKTAKSKQTAEPKQQVKASTKKTILQTSKKQTKEIELER